MKPLYLLLLFYVSSGYAQTSNRFEAIVFESVKVTKDIHYGSNVTQGGKHIGLYLDFYEPDDDKEQNRPLIILAHGGYFLGGNKSNFALEATELAGAGYAVASINYRLIDVENSDDASERAVIDAISDMKAAVRFFRKDDSEVGKYRIDSDRIFIGGYSAGAITAVHYAYVNTAEEVVKMGGKDLLEYVEETGGFNGNSGNEGYSSKISGVINISGSIYSADFMDKDDPPIYSVHGDVDDIVPYKKGTTGDVSIETEGSFLIHQRAEELGIFNQLHTVHGADHAAIYECENCMLEICLFVADIIKN